MDEAEILDNSFNLLFAFDEVVALGYRESVNLAQIRWDLRITHGLSLHSCNLQ